jgi:hypothetical protein
LSQSFQTTTVGNNPACRRSVSYSGCYTDAHVSTCFTVPYELTTSTVAGVYFTQGGPIAYAFLNLAPQTEFIPIYRVYPPGYLGRPDFGHIDEALGFEQGYTHFSTLPNEMAIRFAEVVDCPYTGIYLIPICGLPQDPISPLNNEYVTDISVPLTQTPEPATITFVAAGLVALLGLTYFARNIVSGTQ